MKEYLKDPAWWGENDPSGGDATHVFNSVEEFDPEPCLFERWVDGKVYEWRGNWKFYDYQVNIPERDRVSRPTQSTNEGNKSMYKITNKNFLNKKVNFIKTIRGATGLGLKEAKEIADYFDMDRVEVRVFESLRNLPVLSENDFQSIDGEASERSG